MIPETLARSVEVHKFEARRASAIQVFQQKAQARPNSINPNFALANSDRVSGLISRRVSQNMTPLNKQPLPKLPDEVPALPEPKVKFEAWQAPKTTEEAAVALAAPAYRERMLGEPQERKGERDLEQNEDGQYDEGETPQQAQGQQLTLNEEERPLIAVTGTTNGLTNTNSPEQAAVDLGKAAAPGAVKSVVVHETTLSSTDPLQSSAVTRVSSPSSTKKSLKDKENGHVPEEQLPLLDEQTATPEPRVTTWMDFPPRTSSRPDSIQFNKRKSTASDKRKSTASALSINTYDLAPPPSIPSLPKSGMSPGLSGSSLLSPGAKAQRRSPCFNERAFIANARTPVSEEAVTEADRRSRHLSTSLSTVNHRLSSRSIKAFSEARSVTPAQSRPGSAHGSTRHATPDPTVALKPQESKRSKERAMRDTAVKSAGGSNIAPKTLTGEGKKNNTAASSSIAPETGGLASGRKTPTSTATPAILKKSTKSPSTSRPPSRTGTLASASRSRAASNATSATAVGPSTNSQPEPRDTITTQSPAVPKRQKSLPLLTTEFSATSEQPRLLKHEASADGRGFRFPELAAEPRTASPALIGPSLGLHHNHSMSNFSRPGSSRGLHGGTSTPVTMPAPPDPVYKRKDARQRSANNSVYSIRTFRSLSRKSTKRGNGSKTATEEAKKVEVDQTGGMTEESLALLKRMEDELKARGGSGGAPAPDLNGGYEMRDLSDTEGELTRGNSRKSRHVALDGRTSAMSLRQHFQRQSQVSEEKGQTSSGPESFEKDSISSTGGKKRERGCFGCLGR